MKSLYLRIWLTVVAALALFALVSGWMWQRHIEQERARFETAASERLAAWAELVQRALPASDSPVAEQAEALREWSARLRVPLALDDRRGMRIAASDSFQRREFDANPRSAAAVRLDDGRTLWLARRTMRRPAPDNALTEPPPPRDRLASDAAGLGALRPHRGPMLGEHAPGPALGGRNAGPPGPLEMDRMHGPPSLPGMLGLPFFNPGMSQALGPLILVAMLFVAVAAGAFPVVRRLTRRLEALKQGVQAFGAGKLSQRVDAEGSDEVAAVAATFNQAAERIETLVLSHQSLLANASHELRSPLARLKMAVALYGDAPDSQRGRLRQEIDTNVAELDALVEEVLLASRLDAGKGVDVDGEVDLLAVAAEEASRIDAELAAMGSPPPTLMAGNERLIRRALRNLLENARRYGGGEVHVQVLALADGGAEARVCDRGPGVPAALRERIFEPFFRMPGHAEREGGVGLGLSLVRQIAQCHGGSVHCEPHAGGGSCFVLRLPARQRSAGAGPSPRPAGP